MQLRTTVSLSLVLLAATVAAQRVDPARKTLPEKSARIVKYTMNVKLDAGAKTLTGTQEIRYRNTTTGGVNELRFHLYLNAFRNLRSTHLREDSVEARKRYKSDDEFGEIRLTKLTMRGLSGERDLLAGLRYDAPDDGNRYDRTVAVVPLPQPFGPNTEIVLSTAFEAKLPKAYRRTGWGPGAFFMVAQWFPKLGVLEDKGGVAAWNCHQFHAWTEFYADYGSFDVTIDTPAGWPVGATGKKVGETRKEGDREIRRFVQDDVHDFAWVTDRDYVVRPFTFDGRPLRKGAPELTSVRVRVLLHPEHDTAEQFNRHRRAVETALRFFGERYGHYPYETLTVVDPCSDLGGGRLGGGMEYPTLITCGTALSPDRRRMRPEGVTVHEFGHQFWYGLSGNNEFEESWLDEGINSYSEGRAQDLAYDKLETLRVRRSPDDYVAPGSVESDGMVELGPAVGDPIVVTDFGWWTVRGRAPAELHGIAKGTLEAASLLERVDVLAVLRPIAARLGVASAFDGLDYRGQVIPDLEITNYLRALPFLSFERDIPQRNLYADRMTYNRAPDSDPVVRPAWTYIDRLSYRVNSYQRPSTIMSTLERMMGPDKWWPMMRRFHAQARFAHPTTQDFLRLVDEFGGAGVGRFARDAFLTTKVLDYGLATVSTFPDPKAEGLFDESEGKESRTETIVKVRRRGTLIADVPIRFEFDKGLVVNKVWPAKGQGVWRRYRFDAEHRAKNGKLIRVWVDPPDPAREVGQGPAGIYLLDRNLLDNSWQARPDRRPARRAGLKLWVWIEAVLGFFGGLG